MLGRGLIGVWMEELFVEMDSYAIAFLRPCSSGWGKEEVTRWGLFLRRGVHFFLFISTSLNLGSSVTSSCASLSEQKSKAARCVRSNGPGFIQNSVQ